MPLLAGPDVSQAMPELDYPSAVHENPTVCNIVASFNWSGRAELVGLGSDLSGRDYPDDRMPQVGCYSTHPEVHPLWD